MKKDRETKVTLKVQKKSVEVTLDELGLNYGKVEKVAQKAVDYGKKEAYSVGIFKLRKLKKEKSGFWKKILISRIKLQKPH